MDQKHLGSKIQLLFKIHNKFAPDAEVIAEWTKSLTPFLSVFDEVYEDATLDLEMPSLGQFVELCRKKSKQQTMGLPRPELKPDTSSLNLMYATMSALWLHYKFGWKQSDFQGSVFRQAFEKCFPGEVFNFEKLKQCFTEEEVYKWMDEWEKRNGAKAL